MWEEPRPGWVVRERLRVDPRPGAGQGAEGLCGKRRGGERPGRGEESRDEAAGKNEES